MNSSVIRDTLIVRTNNPQLVERLMKVSVHNEHMEAMLHVWYETHHDIELSKWLLEQIIDYLLEVDHDIYIC